MNPLWKNHPLSLQKLGISGSCPEKCEKLLFLIYCNLETWHSIQIGTFIFITMILPAMLGARPLSAIYPGKYPSDNSQFAKWASGSSSQEASPPSHGTQDSEATSSKSEPGQCMGWGWLGISMMWVVAYTLNYFVSI